MRVTPATPDDLGALVEMWVDLATDQRAYGSHIRPDTNRETIRNALAHSIIANQVLVARGETPITSGGTDDDGDSEEERALGDETVCDPESESETEGESVTEVEPPEVEPGSENDLLGFVQFSLESGDYELDRTRGMISNVYVRPGRRNSGVGAKLLSAAESSLESSGAELVSLEAMADNGNARRFYRRHGYRAHRIVFEKAVDADDDSDPIRNDTNTRLDG